MSETPAPNGTTGASAASSPPRVCMLLESYYPVVGGMETAARNLARRFLELGVPVLVVTRRTDPAHAREETVDGIPVFRVPPSRRAARARWFLLFTCLPALFRLRRRYDVILVPGFRTLGVSAVIAGRLLGKKSVLKAESRGEMSGEFFAGGLQSLGLRRSAWHVRALIGLRNAVLRRADALISLSSDMTGEFRAARVPPERTHVIPQSVDVERFHPASPDEKRALRRKLGLPETGLFVIFTGRLVSYKGLPSLIRAWDRIRRDHETARLLIVGAGGLDQFNWEDDLRRFVVEHNLVPSVVLPGAVRNVEEYLMASDIYALPTENEAFPLALLEAMACGLAAVGTPVGGIPDVIADGSNGLLVAPGEVEPLHNALQRLLTDPALRESLGSAALRTACERYALDRVTQQYLELFRRLG